MEFQFETTLHRWERETEWGSNVYDRKLSTRLLILIVGVLVCFGIFVAGTIWIASRTTAILLLALAGLTVVFVSVILLATTYKRRFRRVSSGVHRGEDKNVIIRFREEGGFLYFDEVERLLLRWTNVKHLQEDAVYIDLIAKDQFGIENMTVRKSDMTKGNLDDFRAFIQEQSKKKLRARPKKSEQYLLSN